MLRKLLMLSPILGLLLLTGCSGQEPVDPKFTEAAELTSEAQQALRRGEFDVALTTIDKAIAIQPTGDRYRIRSETHLDDLPAALADLEKGLKLEPTNHRLLRWKESVEKAMKEKKK